MGKLVFAALAAGAAFCFSIGLQAQPSRVGSEKAAAHGQADRINAEYRAARKQCDSLKGHAQNVCIKEAQARKSVAVAELNAKASPSLRNEEKLAETKADAAYEVDKAKCDDLKGKQRTSCFQQAQSQHKQAIAEAHQTYKETTGHASEGRTAPNQVKK